MATHTIEPVRETLHGVFSCELPPVLTIDSGDTIRFRTLDAGWGLEAHTAPGVPRRQFEPGDPERDAGHALCGPVFIRGAEPGQTLAVRVEALRVGTFGWNVAGGWPSPINERLGITAKEAEHLLIWALDPEALIGRDQYGHTVALRPFLGVLGMPPAEPGLHPTGPPRVSGGNIDCKELVAGSTLYLPIAVPGGLFSTGDGHAAQGDGEVSHTAIECPMDVADLTLTVHENLAITTPRAHTPAGWLTFGFHEDLQEATFIALEAMLDLMGELYGMGRTEALAIASVVVDMRITQIANGTLGVHAVLPFDALL